MSIKSLGRQSLIYGVGHVLSRIVTFLLLPLYTHLFTPDEYGVISLAYAFMGMALIFYRYGMDSALLKYAIAFKDESRIVYLSTIYTMQVITTIAFSAVIYLYSPILSIYILSIDIFLAYPSFAMFNFFNSTSIMILYFSKQRHQ